MRRAVIESEKQPVLTPAQASILRLLSIGDEAPLRSDADQDRDHATLDRRTTALVRLGSLITRDAALPAYQREVQAALDAGASVDEIVSLLLVLAQPAGSSAVVMAAPKLAMALGYDVDAGLESLAP